uniref:Uncharacterized protein n=1 Tax=Oryctolagus cuniculus TaxID=9986 RepID=A0A5F9DD50_RABIT
MGYLMNKSAFKVADPINLRRTLINNLGEDKRTKLHVETLHKALIIRFREIDKEKAALKKFLIKLHRTTGYFPRTKFW